MISFWCNVLLTLAVVVLGELEWLPFTGANGGKTTEFYLLTAMELITICIIPLALRLFKFKKVKRQLADGREEALCKWALYRLDMLSVPMFINAVLYYVYQHAAFGYLAIILFLCLFFIYPSMSRCQSELED